MTEALPGGSFHLAYIDGGTGSMAIQALLAGALSATYLLKTRWATLVSIIAAKKAKNGSQVSE